MANNLRHRHGEQLLVKCAVDSAIVIEVGDMVWLNTDDVRPATSFTWDTNIATTQAAFAVLFIGIAQESSASGQTDEINVDISPMSVYEMILSSATAEVGDPLGPDQTGTGSTATLMDQQLESAVATSSIARCVKRNAAAGTAIEVVFASAYFPNNLNGELG